jgi:predicted membrane protein
VIAACVTVSKALFADKLPNVMIVLSLAAVFTTLTTERERSEFVMSVVIAILFYSH